MAEMIWRGSRELHEEPGSPRRRRDADGTTVTRVFTGPYEDLVDKEPDINDIMEGFGGEILVKTVETIPLEAGPEGPGRMTVTADDKSGSSSAGGGAEPDPVYETEWVQLEKALETHPIFADLAPSTIKRVKQSVEDANEYQTPAWLQNEEDAQKLYEKLLRGQDSYLLFSPVIRATTAFTAKPDETEAGGRDAPPAAAAVPDGYEWLKTASRAVTPGQESTWELVEEWTGADSWDEDIYPAD